MTPRFDMKKCNKLKILVYEVGEIPSLETRNTVIEFDTWKKFNCNDEVRFIEFVREALSWDNFDKIIKIVWNKPFFNAKNIPNFTFPGPGK